MRENTQTPLPQQIQVNGSLFLHSHFPTIQGEGPFCGERALFFRLWGCNLRCPGCDTEYTATKAHVQPAFFVNVARELGWRRDDLVVITGGEPFRQDIAQTIRALIEAGYRVQIETNGVLWLPSMDDLVYRYNRERLSIVCSPKTNRIHDRILDTALAFKYVLRAGEIVEADGLPTRALGHPANPHVARPRLGTPIYVQPMDEGEPTTNALNLDATIRSVMTHGHRLQIQIHKLCNLE